VRFGLFEFDRTTGELFRGGQPVKLQPQPATMLLILLERPGHEVSREELRKRLWPDGTFVDFDVSLASCARKIRQALGDSAENPVFIRTLHKRGYQFIAPVQLVLPSAALPASATQPAALELAREPAREQPIEPDISSRPQPRPGRPDRRGYVKAVASAAGLAIAVPAVWYAYHLGRPPHTADATTLIPVTSFPNDEYDPSCSPDGRKVVCTWAGEDDLNNDLYVIDLTNHALHRLTTDPGREEYAAWSPDGRWIAYIANIQDVYVIPAAGGPARKLAETDVYHLSWLPDSTAVIVGELRHGDPEIADFYAVSLRTGARRPITSPSDRISSFQKVEYSRDGEWFAYTRRPSPDAKPELFVRLAGGGAERQLTAFGRNLAGFTWTTDSRRLVFSSNRTGPFQLWEVDVRHPGEPRLIPGSGDDAENPTCAGPGRFVYERTQRRMNLHSVDLRRRPREVPPTTSDVVFPSTRLDMHAQISPDGKRLAFISDRSGFRELWVGDLTGGEPRQLTSYGAAGLSPESPRWSPDGRQIVFALRETIGFIPPHASDRPSDIYTLDLDTGKVWRVTQWPSNQVRPSFSRDGKWIYFGSRKTGRWEIWKVRADSFAGSGELNNHAYQVTTGGGYEGIESAGGKWLYYVTSPTDMDLWRLPTGDTPLTAAPERVVAGEVSTGWWAPVRDGVFFVDMRDAIYIQHPKSQQKPAYFLDPKRRLLRRLFSINHRIFSGQPDFSAALDGSRAIFSQLDLQNIDLMLIRK
jgi:Tol biopolymer transport system component/DNA-binding winged helix-turn-helix (wHTH) protein